MTYTVIIRRGVHGESGRLAVFYDVVGYGREIVFDAQIPASINPFSIGLDDIESIIFSPIPVTLPSAANLNSLGVLS